MFSSDDRQTEHDQHRPSSFGVRAAILAGLVVATAGGVVAAELRDDPVRMITEAHSTCCPPETESAK